MPAKRSRGKPPTHDPNARPDYERRSYWGGRHLMPGEVHEDMKLEVQRIRLNSGGYAPGRHGKYYGTGAPVFEVYGAGGQIAFGLRAKDRAAAKQDIWRMYPTAQLGR